MGTALVRKSKRSPIQPVMGPGKTGKIDPMMPRITKIKPKSTKIKSMGQMSKRYVKSNSI